MGETTKIQWTHHTFNPWWGCQRVSPGCQHCYAETFDKRVGGKHWGPTAARRTFGQKHWNEPLKWAREAAKAGERHRVFCASMADVFEDRPELEPERQKLWNLIRFTAPVCMCFADYGEDGDEHACACPAGDLTGGGLDWLLLTKRPENVLRMAPADILPLVWVGTTVEDQARADQRIPELLRIPARVRFLSMEPLLGPVDLQLDSGRETGGPQGWVADPQPDWVIVGGESGPGARPFDLAWARSIRDQCASAGVACFVKQLGAVPMGPGADVDAVNIPAGRNAGAPPGPWRMPLKDRKGGDISEWPDDLRVRQFPEVQHG